MRCLYVRHPSHANTLRLEDVRFQQEAYAECAADGPIDVRRFITWYRDHFFQMEARHLVNIGVIKHGWEFPLCLEYRYIISYMIYVYIVVHPLL